MIKASVKTTKLLALFCVLTLTLAIALFAVPAFATDVTTADPAVTTAEPDATTAEPGATTAEPGATTADPSVTTASPDVTTAPAGSDTNKSPKWDLIISLSVIGLAIIVLAVLYFTLTKFRNWVKKTCSNFKSELGKIVWSPWHDVKRNTLVVIIIVGAAALLIWMLDYVFSQGIIALGNLF